MHNIIDSFSSLNTENYVEHFPVVSQFSFYSDFVWTSLTHVWVGLAAFPPCHLGGPTLISVSAGAL